MSCKYILGNKEYTEQEILSYISDNKNAIIKENEIKKVDSIYINKDTAGTAGRSRGADNRNHYPKTGQIYITEQDTQYLWEECRYYIRRMSPFAVWGHAQANNRQIQEILPIRVYRHSYFPRKCFRF